MPSTSSSAKGPSANSIRLDLPKFTLIGATTRAGQLSAPLRDRFGVTLRLELYSPEELAQIVTRSAGILACAHRAGRGHGDRPALPGYTPYRQPDAPPGAGLRPGEGGRRHHRYRGGPGATAPWRSTTWAWTPSTGGCSGRIIENYGGGPVGLETLAATIGEESVTLEDVYEPYLMQLGFLTRTPRGRCVTKKAYDHLHMAYLGQEQMTL